MATIAERITTAAAAAEASERCSEERDHATIEELRATATRLEEAARVIVASITEHVDERVRLFRPPGNAGATAHSDTAVPRGMPILADCGHVTVSHVTDRRTGATRCPMCDAQVERERGR